MVKQIQKESLTGLLVVKVPPSIEEDLTYLRTHGFNISYWTRQLILKNIPKAKRTVQEMERGVR